MKEIKEKSVLNNEPNENVVMQQELTDDELSLAAGGSFKPEILTPHIHDEDEELLPPLK